MKIAIVGKGNVGSTLGRRWTEAGHAVVFGVRSPQFADEISVADAVRDSDIVVLAVPASALTADLFAPLRLDGKVLVDCTNPIAADFSGVEWDENRSGGQKVARLAPTARVVKAFNTVGYNVMADPRFGGRAATLLIAGDDVEAKSQVARLASDIGFAPDDAGPLSQSRYLEAFAWLWISMALKQGQGREIVFQLLKR